MTSLDAERNAVLDALSGLVDCHDPNAQSQEEFWGAQFDAGLAWVDFPVGLGGLAVSPGLQSLVKERLAEVGVSSPYGWNPMGIGMAAPTLLVHGSESQQRDLLRPLFTTEQIWCQLFSEPGAGSDLANLATSAVRDGEDWIINGQKVWTSLAHAARWGLLLARTDPSVPKHRGLSYFIVDMHSPGVTVRPIVQLDGGRDFNEVFLDDVRISDEARIGRIGDGWQVALTTLMNERVAIGSQVVMPRGSGHVSQLLDLWKRTPGSPATRGRVVDLWMQAEVVRLTVIRADQKAKAGTPGAEGAIIKLAAAEVEQRIYDTALDVLGPAGALYPSYEPEEGMMGAGYHDLRSAYLFSKHVTIAGGTSEIMRNILGERVLGLPPEPRWDKGTAWNETLRA